MDKKYYIAVGTEHQGPFSVSELKEMNITPQTFVFVQGMKSWEPASQFPELASLFVEVVEEPKSQKKNVLIAVLAVAVVALVGVVLYLSIGQSKPNVSKTVMAEETPQNGIEALQETGAYLSGKIGGANDCRMAFWKGFGGFSYGFSPTKRVHRQITFTLYEKETGHLVMHSVDLDTSNGSTGDFDGIVTDTGNGTLNYKGKFTNVKGVIIDFDLSGTLYAEEPQSDLKSLWWD